jgi:putative hydrolase of the HAD superfamily
MRKEFVLFDLGNTLVSYYERHDFPGILKAAITEVERFTDTTADWDTVQAEKPTAEDFSVRPLAARLAHIFPNVSWSDQAALEACRRFMSPIFAIAHLYDDVLPTLETLQSQGVKTAIVSNTPWGSPASLWREELDRLGLATAVDLIVFCTDCGWRKPARQIFDYTLERLTATPEQCVFVGDDPRWDIVGPHSVGMDAVLIDRRTQTLPDILEGIILP